ncbi:uncharacterized protein LOC143358388 [Halictus rubicundus]|uniref:uncharacterized protein LOC143358388 n=1 Tax=Halictus rubicundus TaxID=77578 RepID=UPI004035B965
MDSDEISWQTVSNTVTKRMVDLSFVHKLTPSRRLCRRTKVMNTAIKHYHNLKTYRQYIQIKTSILRNFSDDNDTDGYNSSSDNDCNVLYKSDLPLTDYMTDSATTYTDEAELGVSDYNTSGNINQRSNARQSKDKCPNSVNLGWQDIVKKRNVKPTCSPKQNIQKSKPHKPNETNNHESSASSSSKIACKTDTMSSVQETCNRTDKKTYGINKKQETNKNCTKSMEGEINIGNDAYKKLNKNNCSKRLESKEKLNGIKKDLISLLNQETVVQCVDELSANVEARVEESYSTLKIEHVNVQEESADESKSSESSQMQPPFNGNTNQPKDSGIDEDTEEEFHVNGKTVNAKKKKKMPETCKNVNLMSPVVDRKNVSTIEMTLSNTDNLLSDIHDTSDTIDSQCTALFTNDDTNSEKKEENKLQKVKLQPKVTCTKVIKNKYRIISDNALLSDKCLESNINDDHISCKATDPVNSTHNAEDSMSPLSKRRLQQMKRLNLTADSESSLSEDDNEYCNTENMRDKLFKRSKEPSDSSDNEDENMGFKHVSSLQNSKKLKTDENYTFGNNRKEKNICLRETYTDNNESVAKTNGNNYKDTLHCSGETETYSSLTDQYKTNTQNTSKQSVHCSGNENDSAKESTKQERLFQQNHETERISKTDETATQTSIKNSAIQNRPHNLQELMNEENLVIETTLPSVTLKDLQENNVFLIDVPSMVVETELLGRKFILTENKLKLGKHKYKIEMNDINHMSCVFSAGDTGESCTNYKAVTITPMKRFVAYEKIVKTTSKK